MATLDSQSPCQFFSQFRRQEGILEGKYLGRGFKWIEVLQGLTNSS